MLLGLTTRCNKGFGLVTSSAAETMCRFVINYLRQIDEIVKDPAPDPCKELATSIHGVEHQGNSNAFYASPLFRGYYT